MHPQQAKSLKIAAALATIYLVWGSTYLAIRIAVESIPPFLMAGTRFTIAGCGIAAAIAIVRGFHLSRRQWLDNAVIGGLMLLGGNGLVCRLHDVYVADEELFAHDCFDLCLRKSASRRLPRAVSWRRASQPTPASRIRLYRRGCGVDIDLQNSQMTL